jgi:hypothetical protein
VLFRGCSIKPALPSRNAGLKEDSPQKNRKIRATAHVQRRQWKQYALLRTILKNMLFSKENAGACWRAKGPRPGRAFKK